MNNESALNFADFLAKLLIGTATQAEVDLIHSYLSDLNKLTEEERKTLNVHSGILNITIRDLRHANAAIKRLEAATGNAGDIISRFSIKTRNRR